AAVPISPQAMATILDCTSIRPAWLASSASGPPGHDLTRAQCLELADLAAAAEWECQQAAGADTADTAAAACRALVDVLEQIMTEMLLGREVIVSDAWMTTDPDDDLERPMVHRGIITAATTTPTLKLTLAADTGRTLTVDARLWTVTDRATGQVLYGPTDRIGAIGKR
ncbi:hypothetical protein, partial [Streptomyces sp. NPDC006334]|uniref:hypothetical protein n=1 Tax=Streptomyces sp. NPDC006334 TaxID=3156754 RepID=UPI0033AC7504